MLAFAATVHALAFTTPPVVGPLDTLFSGLASIARLPYGTDVAELRSSAAAAAPAADLVLYESEGSAPCRRVREVITYLDLCCSITPCAAGSRHRQQAAALAGGVVSGGGRTCGVSIDVLRRLDFGW